MAPPFPFPCPRFTSLIGDDLVEADHIDCRYRFIKVNLQSRWLLVLKVMEIDWIWMGNGLRLLVEGKGLGIGVGDIEAWKVT